MPHPLVEAFGRPTWREVRAPAEARDLRSEPVELRVATPQPIVVVPGFLGSEASLDVLVQWLRGGGHPVQVAELDRNMRGSRWAVERIDETVTHLTERSGERPVLVGHSRGGQQARVAAMRRPSAIGGLITLGAPFRHHIPRHVVLRIAVEALRAASRLGVYRPEDIEGDDAYVADLARPFEVDLPFVSIWSRSDGFVAWQQCVDAAADNIEVDCSHRGLVESRAAFMALAQALAAIGSSPWEERSPSSSAS